LSLLAILIELNVPLDSPSQNVITISQSLIINSFLIDPAFFPYLFQSGKYILVSILYSFAYCSANLSAPIALLLIINLIKHFYAKTYKI